MQVRQQLDSFNEFVTNTIQSVVSESFPIEVYDEPRRAQMDDDSKADDAEIIRMKTRLEFGQIYVSDPQMREGDGAPEYLFPATARLRNLTYRAPLFVDVTRQRIEVHDSTGEEKVIENSVGTEKVNDIAWLYLLCVLFMLIF